MKSFLITGVIGAILASGHVAAQESGVTNLLRSLTGALGNSSSQTQPQQQKGLTTTMGVRGMDDGEQVAQQGPASEDYRLMEGWMASATEASMAAKKKGLQARTVSLRNAGSKP